MEHLKSDATWEDIGKALEVAGVINERVISIGTANRTENGDLYIKTSVSVVFLAGLYPLTYAEATDMLKEVGVVPTSVFHGVSKTTLNHKYISNISIQINTHIPKGCLVKV